MQQGVTYHISDDRTNAWIRVIESGPTPVCVIHGIVPNLRPDVADDELRSLPNDELVVGPTIIQLAGWARNTDYDSDGILRLFYVDEEPQASSSWLMGVRTHQELPEFVLLACCPKLVIAETETDDEN